MVQKKGQNPIRVIQLPQETPKTSAKSLSNMCTPAPRRVHLLSRFGLSHEILPNAEKKKKNTRISRVIFFGHTITKDHLLPLETPKTLAKTVKNVYSLGRRDVQEYCPEYRRHKQLRRPTCTPPPVPSAALPKSLRQMNVARALLFVLPTPRESH